jgi:uncharacterized membrane protein (UPF0127 family)
MSRGTLAVLLLSAAVSACTLTGSSGGGAAASEPYPQDSKPTTRAESRAETRSAPKLSIGFGDTVVEAGIASTADQRRKGLMGRTSLAPSEGLLFMYRTADDRSYWMKGCLIPLDLLYLADDGSVLAVKTMDPPKPGVADANLPRFPSPSPCRLLLEVAGGFATAHGVKQGTRLRLPPSVKDLMAKADS